MKGYCDVLIIPLKHFRKVYSANIKTGLNAVEDAAEQTQERVPSRHHLALFIH